VQNTRRGIHDGTARLVQRLECDRAGALVQEHAIDGEQARASAEVADEMGFPDLVEEGARRIHGVSAMRQAATMPRT